MKILFVCTGNICRSAMADRYFVFLRKKIAKLKNIHASSAGIAAWGGAPASPGAAEALATLGIDASGHKATQITRGLLEEQDLILTMTQQHKAYILREFAEVAPQKVATLLEYALHSADDIDDPFGKDDAEYLICFRQICAAIDAALPRLQQEANS